MNEDPPHDPEVAQMLADLEASRLLAGIHAKPWKTRKPTGLPAFWLGAKWQFAGFYHVQHYRRESIAYLRARPNEYWSGPYDREADWMRSIEPPPPPDPAVELEALYRFVTPLTWSQIPEQIRTRWALVRRAVHCRQADVEIPDNHRLTDRWHQSTKTAHAAFRRQYLKEQRAKQ